MLDALSGLSGYWLSQALMGFPPNWENLPLWK
jgi:hypothetical protein